jgi:putative aldouronate transport system permease protein
MMLGSRTGGAGTGNRLCAVQRNGKAMNSIRLPSPAGSAANGGARSWRFRRKLPLYLMLVPGFVILAMFHFYPMYGVVIAFQKYEPLLGFTNSPWVGLDNFKALFTNPDIAVILRNTVVIALGKIVLGQLASIVFALLLNEIRLALFKRVVQTASYILHFLSWMIFGAIIIDLLKLDGAVNRLLGAFSVDPVLFLGEPVLFQPTAILTEVWKSFGWGAIIYIAALTSIDPTLYEAAAVDGAGRWQRIRHITLPGIAPTIVLLSCLSLGGVLNAGFEQVFVLYNSRTLETADIIDTYVYRVGLIGFQYSFATAVGLLKSLVSLVLITLSYYLAGRLANYRIF